MNDTNNAAGPDCTDRLVRDVWKHCHGPALQADAEKCISIKSDASGGHKVPNAGDAANYNGVRTWRCPECFEEHRRRIAQDKALPTHQDCDPDNLSRVVEAIEAERISSANA
jgi:hypothetical protein